MTSRIPLGATAPTKAGAPGQRGAAQERHKQARVQPALLLMKEANLGI
jgi:hypothetical protein